LLNSTRQNARFSAEVIGRHKPQARQVGVTGPSRSLTEPALAIWGPAAEGLAGDRDEGLDGVGVAF